MATNVLSGKTVRLGLGLLITLLAVLAFTRPAAAWSRKGHVLITRSAVKLLVDDPTTPAALRALLLQGLGDPAKLESLDAFVLTEPYTAIMGPLDPGLELFSYRPDDLAPKRSPVPTFNNTEDRLHYLNLERFHADPERRKYAPDGSNKAALADVPRDWHDERYATAGLLTFRVEQVYKNLVQSLAVDDSAEQIYLWMGFLAHYASDAFQPYHSTLNFTGLLCPANQGREKESRHLLHAELEETIFSDESPGVKAQVAPFWKRFKDVLNPGANQPAVRSEPYDSTLQTVSESYEHLAFLCRAATAAFEGGGFNRQAWFAYAEVLDGRKTSVAELQGERMALATLAVRTFIRQAWDDATRIGNPPPVPPPPGPRPPPMPAPVPPPKS